MLLALKEKGLPTPALDTMPELPPHLSWPYAQYNALTRERAYAHDSPLPLRLADIVLYWRSFVRVDFEAFYDDIVTIDTIYLKLLNKRREAKQKEKPQTRKPVR